MSYSTTYRQLVLRLPDGLKETMRERVAADAGLEGVHFIPEKKGSRRFIFTMDGKKYPARLVDMPCVLETQKTLDKTTFFKSGDIGQMLIVYKDENSYKKDDGSASAVGPLELYPDGLTPPTKNIVRRRFLKARPDRGKFHPTEVICVESQVLRMQQDNFDGPDKPKKGGGLGGVGNTSGGGGGLERGGGNSGSSSRGGGSGGGGGGSSSRTRTSRNSGSGRSGGGGNSGGGGGSEETGRIIFEHEEIVMFEPWMADPNVAALGRLEGITLEFTGATEKVAEATAAAAGLGAGGDGNGGGTGAPRLFGSELLYEHPEILLSAVDAPADPTLQPPPPRPKTEPLSEQSNSAAAKKSAALKRKQQQQQQEQQQQQQAGRSGGVAVGTPAAAAAAASAAVEGVAGLDADEASAVMDDMNDAEDVLGVEDIFSGV